MLAFTRGDDIACVFNLSADDVTHELGASGEVLLAEAATVSGRTVNLGPNGLVLLRLA